jgi:hypothetical protein
VAQYFFQDIALDVQPDELGGRARLARLCANLSFVPGGVPAQEVRHHVSIRLHDETRTPPSAARAVFHAGGFTALQLGESLYLTNDSSLFHLRCGSGLGDAYLAPSFFGTRETLQSNFWSFGLLKLLRPIGLFSLHAAALVTPAGQGILVIGPSGSGKSTLALGLIRHGWGYLTDDAILIRRVVNRIRASALREHFYIDASAAFRNCDLPLDDVVPDKEGRDRRRVHLQDSAFCAHRRYDCIPELLLFPRIVPQESSVLLPIDRGTALKHLLEASGPQLFDRQTMEQHLAVLKQLLGQTTSFELRAGLDLYRSASTLVRLLAVAPGSIRAEKGFEGEASDAYIGPAVQPTS